MSSQHEARSRTVLQVETLEDRRLMATLMAVADSEPSYLADQKLPWSDAGYVITGQLRPGIELPAPPGAQGPQPQQYDNTDVYAIDGRAGDTYVVQVVSSNSPYPAPSKYESPILLSFAGKVEKATINGPASETGSFTYKIPESGAWRLIIGANTDVQPYLSHPTASYTVKMERIGSTKPPVTPPPTTPTTPTAAKPDIAAVSLTSDGTRLGYTYDVVGKLPSSGFVVRFAQSTDAVFSSSDTTLTGMTLTGSWLTPGRHTAWVTIGTASGNIRLPGAGLPSTDAAFFIVAKADPDEKVGESNGKNNEAACSPDIAVSKARYDGSFTKIAYDLAARDITKNFGVSLYQSKTPKFNINDAKKLASQTMTPKDTRGSFTLASAPAVQEGRYLFVVADAEKKIWESTEVNNAAKVENAWTIFVYMTPSDLALGDYDFQDINEMENAASRLFGVDIVVYWDQPSGYGTHATGNGQQAAWGGVGRGIISGDTNAARVATTFEVTAEAKSGDPTALRNFLKWGAEQAPARNYSLFIWSHGAGIHGAGFDWESDGQRPSQPTTADHLSVPEIASAISGASLSLQLLAFDACTMATAEVVSAMRGVTGAVAASQEKENGSGHNYITALRSLENNPLQVTGWTLGKSLVASFQQEYRNDPFKYDTYSLASTVGAGGLETALKSFVAAIKTALDAPTANRTVIRNHLLTATMASNEYDSDLTGARDLGTFLAMIRANPALRSLHASADVVTRTLSQNVIGAKTADQRNSSGLSIYLPGTSAYHLNDTFLSRSTYVRDFAKFNTATNWGTLVNFIATGNWTPLTEAAAATRSATSSTFTSPSTTRGPLVSGSTLSTSVQAIDVVFSSPTPVAPSPRSSKSTPLPARLSENAMILALEETSSPLETGASLAVKRNMSWLQGVV